MHNRLILPALAALALLAANPASAQFYSRYSYAPQGGGGAGPYALQCRRFANFNQREHCTTLAMERYHWRHHRRYYR
jgi:hypothetical protein